MLTQRIIIIMIVNVMMMMIIIFFFFFTRGTYDPSGDTKIVRRQNIILDSLERLRLLLRVRHDEGAAEGNSVETLYGYREPLKQKTGFSSVSGNAGQVAPQV